MACAKLSSIYNVLSAAKLSTGNRGLTAMEMKGPLQRANVVLRGGGLDESPDCYKRLPEVLAAHGETIRILHTLTPLGVAMAGANEFDPYKD